jgi:hypothetical protein
VRNEKWGQPRTEAGTSAGPLSLSRTSKLRVSLLHVAQPLHEHFHRDVIIVSEEVSLCAVPRKVDERVGVGRDSCEAGEDVADAGVSPGALKARRRMSDTMTE